MWLMLRRRKVAEPATNLHREIKTRKIAAGLIEFTELLPPSSGIGLGERDREEAWP